jgi:hypothetical protein
MKILVWFGRTLLFLYFIVAIFLIASLLSFNEYNITVFGKTSFVVPQDDSLEPEFSRGDLLLIKRNDIADISEGDRIFFYETYSNDVTINIGTVDGIREVNANETTFTLVGEYDLSSQHLIGKVDTVNVYSGMGTVFEILQSRYGFLFLIILPIFVSFMYGIYALVREIKADVELARKPTSTNPTE